ncbi:unnamed protein product, partial [Porites lobata]
LGFLCRSDFDTHDQRARRPLYLSLVRSSLAYCSHVWAPQAVNLILDIERIQRRATKIILSLPYRDFYRDRNYYLDLVYVFKFLMIPRRTVSSKGTLLNTIRPNTVTFENSFYRRAPRIWSTLPAPLRNTDCSVAHFKKDLFNYYLYLTKSIYDVD